MARKQTSPAHATSASAAATVARRNAATATVVVLRPTGLPTNRTGRAAEGLYPTVSRTLLALHTGRHVSTITGILKGRTKCTLDLATKISRAIGVPMEKLNADLQAAQLRFAQARVAKLKLKPLRRKHAN